MDINQLLSDLKNVDPNNPGSWPWAVKFLAFIAMFIAVLVAGYFFEWQDQLQTYSNAQAEEGKLKQEFLSKKAVAVNLDLIRKQLLDTQQSFGALLKQLPNKSEMDALLTDINQAGLGRGLQFNLFRPENEARKGVLIEQPISIVVQGDYDDLGNFASDIAQLPRIVTLTDISIHPGGSGLVMNTTARTYRYSENGSSKRGAKR
jgi:type IV pilus assembly protein PilO